MKIPELARKLKNRLLGTDVKPYAPSFAEDDVVFALRKHMEAKSHSTDPRHEVDPSRLPTCREDLVAYFRQCGASSFFADSKTLAALARGMVSHHPGWRARLLAMVAADRTGGLKIYSMIGPPLGPGFPWGGLPSEPNNDDLYSIRPHRFGFAPRYALAVLYGEESAETLADVLEDWMTFVARGTSEFPYCSALVVIQRLLALSWARAFVMALPDPEEPANIRLHAVILRILHADIGFLMPRLGKSAPNNHLLADQFASWYIRLLFPEFVSGPVDLDAHEAVWLAELERQIYPDGTSFEHSLHYHEFACEMAVAYVLLCRRNSRPIPWATLERVERMLGFQAALAGPDSVTVPFGDATEDPLFALDPGETWATAGLRELYRALFRPELSPARPTLPSVERAFWLLGGALASSRSSPVVRELGPQIWGDGGFAVLPDDSSWARLIFRSGPARHLDVAAGHMHGDLLSVCVTHAGQPVLTDSGTWSYRWRSPEAGPGRSYFSGPAAHNGPSIAAIDPLGTVQGDFRKKEIPVRVSTTRCVLGERLAWLEAEIHGSPPYAGHRRGVVHVLGAYWIIYDVLSAGDGIHAMTLGFQTAAGVEATGDESGAVQLRTSAGILWLAPGPGLDEPRIIRGESDPPGGWVAPSYGELIPATQLRYGIANGATVTALALGTGVSAARPIASRALRTGLFIEIEGAGGVRDRLLLATHDERIKVEIAGGHGEAAAVWVRTRGDQSEAIRCLGFRETEYRENNAPNTLLSRDAETTVCVDNNGRGIECREPKELSMSLSGEVWC